METQKNMHCINRISRPETGGYAVDAAEADSAKEPPLNSFFSPRTPALHAGSRVAHIDRGVSLSGLSGSVGDLPRGVEVEGAIGPGDDVLGTGAFGQGWGFEGRAGEDVAFELISDVFDALLYLMGPGLSSPLVDDDGAGNRNSRIEVTLPEDGLYTLVVSALEAGSEGAFRLRAFRRVVR